LAAAVDAAAAAADEAMLFAQVHTYRAHNTRSGLATFDQPPIRCLAVID